MSRIVYVNGEFLPEDQAKISIFDRGFLFADGVYEVTSILNGRLIDNTAHLVRLQRSLSELNMRSPESNDRLTEIQLELAKRNNLQEGMIYLQITRGAADRDFKFPKNAMPSLVMFTQTKALIDNPQAETGISVITVPDIRWKRRDIKSVGLLAPSMAKQAAAEAGADDAWMIEDGFITEGSSNNAYIVNDQGAVITRHLGNEILSGITRKAVLRLAKELQIKIEERPFSVDEAKTAQEAFVTSASTFVCPVVKIDDHVIGTGFPGSMAKRLRQIYIDTALADGF